MSARTLKQIPVAQQNRATDVAAVHAGKYLLGRVRLILGTALAATGVAALTLAWTALLVRSAAWLLWR